MMFAIESEVNGKKYLVGNVGGAMLQYGLVPPTDSRALKFCNPSVCNLALETIRREYRGNTFRTVVLSATVDSTTVATDKARKPSPYEIWDVRLNRNSLLFQCNTREEAYKWIVRGMASTEGAERDHFVSLLLQLEDGKSKLYYDLDA